METARLEALLERLQTTKSIGELQVWAHELRDHFGVTHVFYHTATLKSEQVGAFTYSLEWARHYIENDYRSIDPVVLGAQRRFHPMDWKTLDWSSPQARAMMREAMAHGLGNQGWSVPIWGPNGEFALFCAQPHHRRRQLGGLHHEERQGHPCRFAPDARAGDADHQQGDGACHRRALAARARDADAAQPGQSRAEVADPLQISENTLRAYIDSARHKLGALNVTHAVALALAKGIIVPTGALPKY